MSKVGLVIAVAYTVLVLGCVAWGYGLPKTEDGTVLVQLPILLNIIVFQVLGVEDWLAGLPVFVLYGFLTNALNPPELEMVLLGVEALQFPHQQVASHLVEPRLQNAVDVRADGDPWRRADHARTSRRW